MKRDKQRVTLRELPTEAPSLAKRELTPAELSPVTAGQAGGGGGGPTCTFNDDFDGTTTGGFGYPD